MNCNKIVIKLVSRALSNKKKGFHALILSNHSVLMATSLDDVFKKLQIMNCKKKVIKLVSTALANKKREDFHLHIVTKHSALITTSLDHVVKKLQIMNCNKMTIKLVTTALLNQRGRFSCTFCKQTLRSSNSNKSRPCC